MGLEKMGAEIRLEHGYVNGRGKLKGAEITFDQPTVTGTENILMAATMAKGVTTIHNAAQEPEVVDLADALNKMGARINGAGTEHIEVEGVRSLKPATHSILPDRIEAGTYMVAAGITNGEVFVEKVGAWFMQALLDKLQSAGLDFEITPEGIVARGTGRIRSVDLQTAPFPGFPTDMQAQFMALMAVAPGLTVITENVFENRFMHVAELKRMGANVRGRGAERRGAGCGKTERSAGYGHGSQGQRISYPGGPGRGRNHGDFPHLSYRSGVRVHRTKTVQTRGQDRKGKGIDVIMDRMNVMDSMDKCCRG